MSSIDKALLTLNDVERTSNRSTSAMSRRDVRGKLIVTVAFLVAVLSFPLDNLGGIIIFAIYPIVGCTMADISYGRVLKLSLYTLPFIAFIGIFNPIFDQRPMLHIGSVTVSEGWIQFLSIIVRGLLSVQATLLLILSSGFITVCRGMKGLGMPDIFATQLFLLYRYIFVLLQEARSMQMARTARGYGRTSYGMRFWSVFVGQLLLRTADHAERLHRAMLSRGFSGMFPLSHPLRWHTADTIFVIIWTGAFVAGRLWDIPLLFTHLFNHV